MLDHLSCGKQVGDLLARFAQSILDNVNNIFSRHGAPTRLPSTFGERLVYYQELCRTGSPPEAWRPTEMETTHNYLRGAITRATATIGDLTTMEPNGDTDGQRAEIVRVITGYIKTKLEDVEFRQTFANLGESFMRKTREQPTGPERIEIQLL